MQKNILKRTTSTLNVSGFLNDHKSVSVTSFSNFMIRLKYLYIYLLCISTWLQYNLWVIFLQSWGLLFFLHLSCHEFTGNGIQQLRLLSSGSHEMCFSGWGRLALHLNPSTFLFGFPLFLIIFLHMLQEAISALWVLNMLNTYINSLGKSLALVCLRQCPQQAE